MKAKRFGIVASLMLFGAIASSSNSFAAPVTFNFNGVADDGYTAIGSLSIDNSLFDGSASQDLLISNISSFSFSGNTGSGAVNFDLSDLTNLSSLFVIDSSGVPAVVIGSPVIAFTSAYAPIFYALSIHSTGTSLEGTGGIGEAYAGIWIEATLATPLPAALPLFATGLGLMGLLGWRRKRIPKRTAL